MSKFSILSSLNYLKTLDIIIYGHYFQLSCDVGSLHCILQGAWLSSSTLGEFLHLPHTPCAGLLHLIETLALSTRGGREERLPVSASTSGLLPMRGLFTRQIKPGKIKSGQKKCAQKYSVKIKSTHQGCF